MTHQNKRLAGSSLPHVVYLVTGTVLFALVAYTLWMAFYLPVYGDETYWKLLVSRLVSDDGYLVYIFAQCSKGQWIEAPWTWLPAMALSSFFYEDASHPWVLRMTGWFLYLGLLLCWIWLLRRRSGLSWLDSSLAVCAFLSVGVLPFLMVYDRPEKTLLVLLTAVLILVPSESSVPKRSVIRALVWIVFLSLLAALLAGVHPKGLFFFPVLLAVLYLRTRSWVAVLLLLGVLGWIAQETMAVWQQRTNCPEFPGLMTVLQNLTLRPSAFFSDPVAFVQAAWRNLLAFNAYIDSIALQPTYVVNWLPAVTADPAQPGWYGLVNWLNWIPIVLAAGLIVFNLRRAGSAWWRSTGVVWLMLFLALLFIVSLQSAKNFYEVSLVWPLIGLLAVMSFVPSPTLKMGRRATTVILTLVVIAVASSIARIDRFSAYVPDWIFERTQQIEQRDQENQTLQAFATTQCAIDDHAVRLAIDETTYPAFWRHRKPIFLDFSAGWWAAEADLMTTLRQRRAEGVVAACDKLPDALRSRAKTLGQTCCVSAQNLR